MNDKIGDGIYRLKMLEVQIIVFQRQFEFIFYGDHDPQDLNRIQSDPLTE